MQQSQCTILIACFYTSPPPLPFGRLICSRTEGGIPGVEFGHEGAIANLPVRQVPHAPSKYAPLDWLRPIHRHREGPGVVNVPFPLRQLGLCHEAA